MKTLKQLAEQLDKIAIEPRFDSVLLPFAGFIDCKPDQGLPWREALLMISEKVRSIDKNSPQT